MLHSRFSRLTVAAVAASASIAGVVAFAFPAQAVLSIKCTGLTGTVSGTIQATGCTGNTGGSSMVMPTSSLLTGGTVTWTNGKTTTIGKATTTGTEHDTTETKKCPAHTTETEAKGPVTKDTTGSVTIPGKYTVEVCVDSAQNIKIEPGSKLVIN